MVMPIGAFLIGLLVVGVLTGLRVFVGTSCGGAGKLCKSTEPMDSVDLPFLIRVGAMLDAVVVGMG